MAVNITMLLLGLLTFSSLIAGAVTFSNGLVGLYDSSNTVDVSGVTEIYNVSALTESSQNKLTNSGSTTVSTADVVLLGGWNALVSLISLPQTVTNLIGKIIAPTSEGGLGLDWTPVWIIGFIIAAITIFVVYRIAGISTRSETGGI